MNLATIRIPDPGRLPVVGRGFLIPVAVGSELEYEVTDEISTFWSSRTNEQKQRLVSISMDNLQDLRIVLETALRLEDLDKVERYVMDRAAAVGPDREVSPSRRE